MSYLQETNARVVYVKGKDNILADFLSRNIKGTPIYDMTHTAAIEFHSLLEDNTELRNKQQNDPIIHGLYTYLSKQVNSSNTVQVNKSYAKYIDKLSINTDRIVVFNHKGEEKIVVPPCSRKDILELCHNGYLSGHQGIYKTHQRVLCRFWWPNLFTDVMNLIRQCDICQRTKVDNKKKGIMCTRVWPTNPLDCVSIDFLVDLPKTDRGNIHVLVINDHFSRYIRLYAINDRRAETAAKYVADFCMTFGIPRKLLSDRDPAYESVLFQELMRILEIKKIRTSGYRPQSNGLTEQSNATIKRYLTAFLDERDEKTDWDLLLRQLAYAYNSSVHTSTKYTPAELMFGRAFRIPTDILYGDCDRSHIQSVEEFQRNMISMYRCAKRVMGDRQVEMKKYYDKKRTADPLQVGDMVYVYNPRMKNVKLQPKWDGPFEIINKSENVYEVRVVRESKIKCQWLPRDRLRRCYRPKVRDEHVNIQTANEGVNNRLTSDSSSSEDENINHGVPHGYNLRPRPVPAVQRLQVSQLKFI